MKHLILYFSGSGNSLDIAKQIQAGVENCDIQNLLLIDDDINLDGYNTIGFFFPCYVFNTPKVIEDKIKNLTLPENCYYYGIMTYNSTPSGAGKELVKIFLEKQRKLSYFTAVQMANNLILRGNPSSDGEIFQRQEHSMNHCKIIIHDLHQRKEKIYDYKVSWLSSCVPNFVKTKAAFVKDDKFFSTNQCNGCGSCVKLCKLNNIDLIDKKPVWNNQCINCTACINWCPQKAIEYGKKTNNRTRYRNPNITLREMISLGTNY